MQLFKTILLGASALTIVTATPMTAEARLSCPFNDPSAHPCKQEAYDLACAVQDIEDNLAATERELADKQVLLAQAELNVQNIRFEFNKAGGQEALDKALVEQKKLKDELTELTKQISKIKSAIAILEEKIKYEEDPEEMKKLQSELSRLEEALVEAEKNLQDTQSKLEEIDGIVRQLENLKKALEEAQAEVERLKTVIAALNILINDLLNELSAAQDALKNHNCGPGSGGDNGNRGGGNTWEITPGLPVISKPGVTQNLQVTMPTSTYNVEIEGHQSDSMPSSMSSGF